MPLTGFQSKVLQILARNRDEGSYFAGGVVINWDGPRISKDFDLFHDREERLAAAVARDETALLQEGWVVEWAVRMPSFHRAVVRGPGGDLLLEWALDSDFRFFPIEADPLFGFRLHIVDIATNTILAAAGRRAARDVIDLLTVHDTVLPIAYLAWAAAAKDPGLTPYLILDELMRTGRYQQSELDELATSTPLDASAVNTRLRRLVEGGRILIARLPPDDVGCLYLDANGKAVAADPDRLASFHRHFGSRGGHWPTSSALLSEMLATPPANQTC